MWMKIFVVLILGICAVSSTASTLRFNRQVAGSSCGKPSVSGTGLIYKGEDFVKNAWPWMVAILVRQLTGGVVIGNNKNGPKFICGGTLISKKQVLTAAHCIQQKKATRQTVTRDIILVFGAYDLDEAFYSGTFSTSPAEVILHDDWNPNIVSYDADIAMLVTEEEVPITKSIKPICLWENSAEPNINEGYIAGWGKSEEKELNKIPKQLKIPIKKGVDCLLDNPGFSKISSKRTICGGSRKDAGPCLGDSGSGLFIKYQDTFFLRGIVSASFVNEDGSCDVTDFALYTNVLMFTSWIKDQSRTKSFIPSTSAISGSFRNDKCGAMSGASNLIQGGFIAPREIFPWSVLVYNAANGPKTPNYLKTGTLVSNKHVVVPAGFVCHLADSGKITCLSQNQFKMHFGVYNTEFLDDVIQSSVSQVIVHPAYKEGNPREANVALLVASKPIQESQYVSPICLWQKSDKPTGQLGYSVGWGYDEKATYTQRKKYIGAKVESDAYCNSFFKDQLASVIYSQYFCTKPITLGTPCVSDDPFYIKSGDKWFLRGLWANGFLYGNLTCNEDKPTMFEDMSTVTQWIQGVIGKA